MSPHQATFREALRALDLILGWRHPWLPLEIRNPERSYTFWHQCGDGRRLAKVVADVDTKTDDEVTIGLPQARQGGGVMGASVLWCRVQTREQYRRAGAFRPLPTLVIREGNTTRRLLIWALREWLDYFDVEELNKRIAYKIGAVQKYGLPEEFACPAPGTFLRIDRSRPIPVVVSRLEATMFTPAMATRLRKPPPAYDWRNSREAAA